MIKKSRSRGRPGGSNRTPPGTTGRSRRSKLTDAQKRTERGPGGSEPDPTWRYRTKPSEEHAEALKSTERSGGQVVPMGPHLAQPDKPS